MELNGKVAWVVGASSGIGAAVARELARRGGTVAISARREEQLREVSGGHMLVVPLDVTDAAPAAAAAARVHQELGPIELAVLSAGYWKQMNPQHWDTQIFQHIRVNLTGMSNSIAAVLPGMLRRHHGVIAGSVARCSSVGRTGALSIMERIPGAVDYLPGKASPAPSARVGMWKEAPFVFKGAANRLSHLWARLTRGDVFPGGLLAQARTLRRTRTHLCPAPGSPRSLPSSREPTKPPGHSWTTSTSPARDSTAHPPPPADEERDIRSGQSWLSALYMPASASSPSRSKAGLNNGATNRAGPLKVNSAE